MMKYGRNAKVGSLKVFSPEGAKIREWYDAIVTERWSGTYCYTTEEENSVKLIRICAEFAYNPILEYLDKAGYTNRIKKPEEKKELWMSEKEIASKVRRGVDVRILAELNLTTPEYIRTIARSAGMKEIPDQSKMRYTDHGIHRVSHQ